MALAAGLRRGAAGEAQAPRRAGRPTAHVAPASSARARCVTVRAAWRQTVASAGRGLALSLFHRFRGGLPPDGELLPLDEQMCDPYLESCRTPLHVHECQCASCAGSGWARAPSRARGAGRGAAHTRHAHRGALHPCLACHGLGYARKATVEMPLPQQDEVGAPTFLTMARPSEADPRVVSRARLQAVLRGARGGGAAASPSPPSPSTSAAVTSSQQQQQKQQQQKEREAAMGAVDRAALWRAAQKRWGGGGGGEGPVAASASPPPPPVPPRSASPAPAK